MSYCVNCGVKLEKTISVCPLCDTPVYNPKEPVDTTSPKPFPEEKGIVAQTVSFEGIILFTIAALTITVVCNVLNNTVFEVGNWSSYVTGASWMIWVFSLPFFFPNIINMYTAWAMDLIAVTAYLWWIARLHPGNGWYYDIAVPIIGLTTVLSFIYIVFTKKYKRSIVGRMAIVVTTIGIISMSIEALVEIYIGKSVDLTWSIVVMACVISIDVILFIIASSKGLRQELRKRLHF